MTRFSGISLVVVLFVAGCKKDESGPAHAPSAASAEAAKRSRPPPIDPDNIAASSLL